MSYTPYEWKNGKEGGTPINADNLNHIEQGIHDNSVEITNLENEVEEVKKSVNIGAIITGATGEEITLTDSAEAPVQSLKVYGKSTQTQTSGRQLFENSSYSKFQANKSTIVSKDGKLELSIAGNAGWVGAFASNTMELNTGDTYSVSADVTLSVSGNYSITIGNDGSPIGSYSFVAGKPTRIKTQGDTAKSKTLTIYMVSVISSAYTMKVENIMVEKGSVAHDYEPYTGGIPTPNPDYPQPISDVDNAEVTVRGRNLWGGGTGQYKMPKLNVGDKFTVTNNSDSNFTMNLFTNYGDDTRNDYWTVSANSKRTITVAYETSAITIYPVTASMADKIMIELGDTAHDFEPYKAPQTTTIPYTLRGIGNVKDELLVNADGTGKLITRFGSVDLGTLNWVYQSISGHERFVATSMSSIVKGSTDKANAMCDKLGIDIASNTYAHAQDNTLSIAQDGNIWCYVSAYTDANTFKSAMNGVNLIYELATPTETNLTSEEVAQILVLNTFNPTSIISNNKQAEMEVKYIADTKAYVDAHSGGGSTEKQVKIKTYTGNGNTTNTITFDEQPKMILGWSGRGEGYTMSFVPFTFGEEYPNGMYRTTGGSQSGLEVTASYSGNSITLSAPNSMSAFNGNGGEYKIVYI